MIVIGVDPSLCNTGLAVVEVGPGGEKVLEVLVVRTEPSAKKRRIRVGDDTARRIAEIASALDAAIGRHKPVALVVEAPAGSKGARAAAALAGAMASVVTVATLRRLPLVHVQPLDVKRAMVGKKAATKDEIVLAVERRHPEVEWVGPAGVWEHEADAIGAVVAALDSETLRLARRLAS